MKLFLVKFKTPPGKSIWDEKPILVVASDYANAQDKATNFHKDKDILSIQLYGTTTHKNDVYQLLER